MSKAGWNESRSPEQADFFTFGYSGRKTAEIIDLLKRHAVRTVVDIRQNAVSMHRPDLSKRNFARLLEEHGIVYCHLPELGVPRDVRAQAVDSGSRDIIWSWYDRHVVSDRLQPESFMNAFQRPIALMCTEIDPQQCHRHRLSLALERLGLASFDL